MDFDELRSRVAGTAERMPKRLADAARHLLSQPDDVALGTAASIAAAAGVQPSTLVRLAHHLGFEGFSDMQAVFRSRLRSRASSYGERLEQLKERTGKVNPDTAILNGFIMAANESLRAMSASIDPEAMIRSVELLAGAETIHLLANRRAYALAAHMSYGFSRMAIRSQVLSQPNGIEEEIAAMITARDAVIACSFEPYAARTVDLCRSLAARNIPIVAITDSALSPLAAFATHWMEVSEADFGGFRSLSASIALASALPVAIAERRLANRKNPARKQRQ